MSDDIVERLRSFNIHAHSDMTLELLLQEAVEEIRHLRLRWTEDTDTLLLAVQYGMSPGGWCDERVAYFKRDISDIERRMREGKP